MSKVSYERLLASSKWYPSQTISCCQFVLFTPLTRTATPSPFSGNFGLADIGFYAGPIHQTGNHDVDLLHKCLEFRTTLACWEAECNCFVHYRCIFFCQLSRYDMFRIFKATNLLIGIISTTISYFLKRFIIVLKSSLQGY